MDDELRQVNGRRTEIPALTRRIVGFIREHGMNSITQVMNELRKCGSEQTRKTYARHGIAGDVFGVRVADLKVIARKIKGNQKLACELFETGNYDAMYLAGLVADGKQMSKTALDGWARTAKWVGISEYAVPWVASESPHGRDMAMKWIKLRKNESIESCGWCTYSSLIAITPDEDLDLAEIKALLAQVEKEIDASPNRVRYTMNGFVIAVAAYVTPLMKQARATAKKIGKVEVDMGDTACKVPLATEYIDKLEKAGRVGKKRKTARC